MLAMAVVNHKGGSGGLGSKSVNEDDDILITLRRLRQTLQECHGRVGIMDQRVDALQPHCRKGERETKTDLSWINFHNTSFEDYAEEDEIYTEFSGKARKPMVNGMTNGFHNGNGIEAQGPTNDGGFSQFFPKATDNRNLYTNDLAQPASPTYPVSLELELMHLAEKHAKELCEMYQSKSNTTADLNCETMEQGTMMMDIRNAITNGFPSEKEEKQDSGEKHLKPVPFQVLSSISNPLSGMNGMKFPGQRFRKFSKCKELWSERLSYIKQGEHVYQNGSIETDENEESSRLDYTGGVNDMKTGQNVYGQEDFDDYFEKEDLNNYSIPKRDNTRENTRRGHTLARAKSVELEDMPEERVEQLRENGMDEFIDDEENFSLELQGEGNSLEMNESVHDQEDFKSYSSKQEDLENYSISRRDSSKGNRRRRGILIRQRSTDLEDLPEERESPDYLLHEESNDKTDVSHETILPVAHEMDVKTAIDNEKQSLVNGTISTESQIGNINLEDLSDDCELPYFTVSQNTENRTTEYHEARSHITLSLKRDTTSDEEEKSQVKTKNLTEINSEGDTRCTKNTLRTVGTASMVAPVIKIQNRLDVDEESSDNNISEFDYDTKQNDDCEKLNFKSLPNVETTKEDSGDKISHVENGFQTSDVLCSKHMSKICSCNRKWGYLNKAKEHNGISMLRLHGISEDSRNLVKIRGRNNIVIRLSKQRGSEPVVYPSDIDKLLKHRQYKDNQSWLYKFIIFMVFIVLLFFAFYILLTVPIITLTVKHNGGPVAF